MAGKTSKRSAMAATSSSPRESKQKEVRYLDIREDDRLDEEPLVPSLDGVTRVDPLS